MTSEGMARSKIKAPFPLNRTVVEATWLLPGFRTDRRERIGVLRPFAASYGGVKTRATLFRPA